MKYFNSLKTISDRNRIIIPQNIVFDADGYEVEPFNEKLCANHTFEFLKTYDKSTKMKLTKYHITDYLSNFKMISDSTSLESIIDEKEIRVFVHSGTFGEKLNVNKEAFTIHKTYKDKFNVYVVNLDIGEWNSN
ncbi:hypothetical protein [Flavobacterium lacus]|uniref:hypothetical protein n=1 Tax=Flavobacterium lacus TaxID=1353778 RepID=UPI0011BEFD65|nr:hypothetical protein [Flavobacterium lacus]